jgi:FHA domain
MHPDGTLECVHPSPPPQPPAEWDAAWLVARDGTRYPLGDQMQIGRASGCELRLEDESVSRDHAVVRQVKSGWALMDRGSRNGTAINSVRLTMFIDCPLRDGDRIDLGAVSLTFELRGGPDRDQTKGMFPEAAAGGSDLLSPYQLQVVRCLAEPWLRGGEPATNAEIASAIGTPQAADAVKAALRRTYVKAGIADLPTHTKRRQLCRIAKDRRWI